MCPSSSLSVSSASIRSARRSSAISSSSSAVVTSPIRGSNPVRERNAPRRSSGSFRPRLRKSVAALRRTVATCSVARCTSSSSMGSGRRPSQPGLRSAGASSSATREMIRSDRLRVNAVRAVASRLCASSTIRCVYRPRTTPPTARSPRRSEWLTTTRSAFRARRRAAIEKHSSRCEQKTPTQWFGASHRRPHSPRDFGSPRKAPFSSMSPVSLSRSHRASGARTLRRSWSRPPAISLTSACQRRRQR